MEYGINIDCENEGWTALQLAALNGHVDIVSILLNKGAQSGGANREGKTALDIARAEGQDRIAAIILETEFQVRVYYLQTYLRNGLVNANKTYYRILKQSTLANNNLCRL